MTWQTLVAPPSELGESPFWHPDEQMLYWVEAQRVRSPNLHFAPQFARNYIAAHAYSPPAGIQYGI